MWTAYSKDIWTRSCSPQAEDPAGSLIFIILFPPGARTSYLEQTAEPKIRVAMQELLARVHINEKTAKDN